jgi:beta-mannosidase
MSSNITTVLDYGWRWKQRDLDLSVLENIQSDVDWLATCAFPSEVHVELARVGKIPDPYVGFNEHSVQCKFHSKSRSLV